MTSFPADASSKISFAASTCWLSSPPDQTPAPLPLPLPPASSGPKSDWSPSKLDWRRPLMQPNNTSIVDMRATPASAYEARACVWDPCADARTGVNFWELLRVVIQWRGSSDLWTRYVLRRNEGEVPIIDNLPDTSMEGIWNSYISKLCKINSIMKVSTKMNLDKTSNVHSNRGFFCSIKLGWKTDVSG